MDKPRISRSAAPRRPVRRFDWVDAAVLTLATGIGLSWGRSTMDVLYAISRRPPFPYSIVEWSEGASRLLFLWAVALMVLRLRAPRPRLRVLTRRPGAVATTSALLAALVRCAWYVPVKWVRGFAPSWTWIDQAIPSPFEVVLAIAAGWMALALVRCWWPERSWIDRAGRALAVAWLLLAFGLTFAQPWLDPPVPGAIYIRE